MGYTNQVTFLPIAQSQTRNKHDMSKDGSVYSERRESLPILTSGGEWVGVQASKKSPPASHQVAATPLKLFISQIQITSMSYVPQEWV
jgi:hypothetical protein